MHAITLKRAALLCAGLGLVAAARGHAQVALKGHTDRVRYVAFMPDGKTLLSGGEDNTIRLWDVIDPKEKGVWQQTPKFDPAPSTELLSLSADGLLLARGGTAQGSAEIWNVTTTVRLRTIQAHDRPVLGVVLSANGLVLVTWSAEELKVWEMVTGKQLARLPSPSQYSFRTAAVSADGKLLAASSSDKQVAVYDIVTRAVLAQLDGGPGQLQSLTFSPDGGMLASGSDGGSDASIHLWDLKQKIQIVGVMGSGTNALAVAFSPDGHLLASGGMGVTVWDLTAAKIANTFNGHSGPVRSLAFSPDGSLLASASEDALVGLWKVDPAIKP